MLSYVFLSAGVTRQLICGFICFCEPNKWYPTWDNKKHWWIPPNKPSYFRRGKKRNLAFSIYVFKRRFCFLVSLLCWETGKSRIAHIPPHSLNSGLCVWGVAGDRLANGLITACLGGRAGGWLLTPRMPEGRGVNWEDRGASQHS